MVSTRTLVHPDEPLLILGSLNAHAQDRRLDRSEVIPAQLVMEGAIHPVPSLRFWGELGASSLAWRSQEPFTLYITTGADLIKLGLLDQNAESLGVPNLQDVHEITMIGDTLWLANTGLDEVVAFDVLGERVTERINLFAQGSIPEISVSEYEKDEGYSEVVDKFHCNQVFKGFEGDLYALVHYVSGKQLIRRMGQKLIKRQGNGGIIDITTGRPVELGLKGPHSVRKINGNYWILDSGRSLINVYDADWRLREMLPTKGWGRGADVSEALSLFYAGISETRRRYLDLLPAGSGVPNMVQCFSANGEEVGEIVLSEIEQVNNVYVIPKESASALLKLPTELAFPGGSHGSAEGFKD